MVRMALQRPTVLPKAVFVLLASAPRTSLAAELPPAGRVAQAVGPDGALTQAGAQPATAAVAVDAQGSGAPPSASVLLAAGEGQRAKSYPAPYPSYAPAPPPVAAAPYPSYHVPVSAAPAPATVPAPVGPPCLVPMWNEEEYLCKEHEDYMRNSFTDSLRVVRIEMPDGTKCTVAPPGKWSFWMGSEVTEMMCKAGVWVDGKGAPVTAIEMKTAQWFLIASAVTAAVLAYILYKSFYDAESSWYKWRLDTAIKWGFAKPAPVVEEDKGPDTAPQPAINISIANQRGGQPK